MITIHCTQSIIDELNYLRFHHPDPLVMQRCESVYLKAKGLKTGQIHELTSRNVKTIRTHLRLYKDGGIEALKHRDIYRPQGALVEHKLSIEEEFRVRPPASLNEACERIFQLTGVRRSDTRVEVFLKRSGFKFRKAGGPEIVTAAKADLAKQEEFLKKSWNLR